MLPKIGGNVTVSVDKAANTENEFGEPVKGWQTVATLTGFLDLQSGNKGNTLKTFLEDSTHVFVCDYVNLSAAGVNVKQTENLRVTHNGNAYDVVYIDNPMELNYHLEIYLKFVGWQ